MSKYKVNVNTGLTLPVLREFNGDLIINNEHVHAHQIVECAEETEEMQQQLLDGRLIKLDAVGSPVIGNWLLTNETQVTLGEFHNIAEEIEEEK